MKKNNINAHQLIKGQLDTSTNLDSAKIKELMDSGNHFWIEIPDLEEKDTIQMIFKELNIHSLILNDITNPNQRAKIEVLENYAFCVFGLMKKKDGHQTNLQTLKMSMILSENFLITFNLNHPKSKQTLNYKQLTLSLSKNNNCKIDYLAFLIIEQMMEYFYIAIDDIATHIESIEDLLIESPLKVQLKIVYFLKRKILFMRKIILPYCDIAEILYEGNIPFVHQENKIYFMNLFEQSNRTLESLDFYRDMIANIYDIYLSSTSNYSNQSINMLTRFAAIFIPISFISSFYGMNLIMPELKYPITYPIVLGVMTVTTLCMYYFAIKKRK